ncbi:MAG TPA: DNA cytosine methyltransferase [Flavobacteriales bacterium]|nr:DNA cytosine methyltransferase [Flavobacteriales bacterium]
MKILNLYAGIGGNRKLWGENHEITAVEINPEIAAVYQDLYPNDTVIVADAHQYLLEHSKEYDFIWSSPPCPTHSRLNYPRMKKGIYKYADMTLYQEIIFLTWCFKGKWVVENVISYYNPLIKPTLIGRHYYWSNFHLGKPNFKINDDKMLDYKLSNKNSWTQISYNELKSATSINLDKYELSNKRLALRNAVNPKHALHIFNMAFKMSQSTL